VHGNQSSGLKEQHRKDDLNPAGSDVYRLFASDDIKRAEH
jgi:hypothetical protein